VLSPSWLAAGFVLAGLLAVFGAVRIRDEEIPRVAVLSAAFFVASLMHVRVGPTSVHLLLNGLVGVVLGRRAALAIPVGLFLQAALLGHGGLSALGVNSCVQVLPALFAGGLFACLHRVRWVRQPWFRAGLVAASALVWTLSVVFSVVLLCTNWRTEFVYLDPSWAISAALHPMTLASAAALAVMAAWAERRLENAPEFPLGLLVGEAAVLATMVLNCAVLLWGGQEDWHSLALLTFVAHLPVAVIEGTVLGFTVGFLARVKPEMLPGMPPPDKALIEDPECAVESLP
jgi:cobalt/nickel transport system permease protein